MCRVERKAVAYTHSHYRNSKLGTVHSSHKENDVVSETSARTSGFGSHNRSAKMLINRPKSAHEHVLTKTLK